MSLLMDALRRAETSTSDTGKDTTTPAQETSVPVEHEDSSLSLEPLKGSASQAEAPEENTSETSAQAEATSDTPPVTEDSATPEAGKHGRIRLAPRSTWKQNTLMFGSGFIFILLTVGGYFAWKSGQLPTPGHFQSATLISAPPPVNTAATAVKNTVASKPATVPEQAVAAPTSSTTAVIAPQKRPVQNNPATVAEHRAASPIRISKKRKTAGVNPQLGKAWRAYQQQDFTRAESLYKQVLHRHSDNRDAMLGLAAIAIHQNRDTVARYYYERVLKMHPGDKVARVALQSLTRSGDALKDSSQLKHWLQSDPNNPQLHFALGNHLADSGNWKAAQLAYFEAFRLAPGRADYAFNLAVALDQLALQTQALDYYRKARELAGTSAQFSIKQLEQRISRLQQSGKPGP